MSSSARLALGLGLALGALTALLVGLDTGSWAEAALWCAPFGVLVAPLLLGRYAGEELLEACRERRRRPRFDLLALLGELRSSRRAHVSGGRLIAQALGERGPPLAARCA